MQGRGDAGAGLDLVHALRAEAATRDLPLIVWSTDLDAARRR